MISCSIGNITTATLHLTQQILVIIVARKTVDGAMTLQCGCVAPLRLGFVFFKSLSYPSPPPSVSLPAGRCHKAMLVLFFRVGRMIASAVLPLRNLICCCW